MKTKKKLHSPASKGDLETVKELISLGADVNEPDSVGLTPIHKAFCSGNEELINFLISEGADVMYSSSDSSFPDSFLYVLAENKLKWVKWFIDHGLDPNVVDDEGTNALMNLFGHQNYDPEMHAYLLEVGCDPNQKEPYYGDTAISCLEAFGIQELIDVYKPYAEKSINNVQTDIRSDFGENILYKTIEEGTSKELRELILKNPNMDLNKYNASGETAISLAITLKKKNAAKILLENGANPFIPHKYIEDWSMPLEAAEKWADRGIDKFKEIVEMIKNLPNGA